MKLFPFWRYYGGKWRAAPHYPAPQHNTIVEPFAGAAGYSLRHHDRRVILVEKYPAVAEVWRYLIGVTPQEVRRIPPVDHVDDIPAWVPEGGKLLIRFCFSAASIQPKNVMSAGMKRFRDEGRRLEGWGPAKIERTAAQVNAIKHWRIIEGDYTDSPEIEATWFVDPPYNNAAGQLYVHSDIDYAALGFWCRLREGQVIACENAGADWLPFQPFRSQRNGMSGKQSEEVIWTT